jgi:CRISPR-associated protein Cas6
MNVVELTFPVLGDTLAVDHGYDLYSALSHKIPDLHSAQAPFSIGPIGGDPIGGGELRLNRLSRLRCRLPAASVPMFLLFAGRALQVGSHKVRLGVPNIRALSPAPTLMARLVTIRVQDVRQPTAEQFLEAVRWRLAKSGVNGEPSIPLVRIGPHAGRPRRRILRISGRKLVGFALQITGLSGEDSLRLQAESPFGRRRMGCGFFVPMKREK